MTSLRTSAWEAKQSPFNLDLYGQHSDGEITWLSQRHDFRKDPLSNYFPFRLKRKIDIFKLLRGL